MSSCFAYPLRYFLISPLLGVLGCCQRAGGFASAVTFLARKEPTAKSTASVLHAMTTIEVVPNERAGASKTAGSHLLPCEIQYSGEASVSAYFKPKPGEKRGLEEAAFRGRALKGVKLQPPAGYVGAMLQDTKTASIADGETRRWMHRGNVESFTVWKHDEEPIEDEPIFKVMRWAGIADVLHAHIDPAVDEPPAAADAPVKNEAPAPAEETAVADAAVEVEAPAPAEETAGDAPVKVED